MRKVIRTNLAYDDRNHLYYVTLHDGINADGTRRRRICTFHNRSDAEVALEEHRLIHTGQKSMAWTKITLEEWLNLWMRDYIIPSREKTTIHGYRSMIECHIIPMIGKTLLRELEPFELQHYYAELLRGGISSNTVRKHHTLLRTALSVAKKQGIVRKNITDDVIPPEKKRPKHKYYNERQMNQLFKCCQGTSYESAVKLAGYLGLRRSEICGLKWENVDLKHKEICICEVRTAVAGVPVEKEPKTCSSGRRLGFDGVIELEFLLKRLHREWEDGKKEFGEGYNSDGYVVINPQGKPWHPDILDMQMSKFVRANNLPPITLHGLRHSFASIANDKKVPMYTISKALGHSSISVTSEVYTHLFDETMQDIVTIVANSITGEETQNKDE